MAVMGINAVDFYAALNNPAAVQDRQGEGFKNLFGRLTGGAMAEEIRKNYNVALDVGMISNYQELADSCDVTNYVNISPRTLADMEKNPALKKKILSAIEEFCSQEEQDKVRALKPPVKSAGMIIYPDGRTFYWLEGYSNESESRKDKKLTAGENIHEMLQENDGMDYEITENDLPGILAGSAAGYGSVTYKRKLLGLMTREQGGFE